jgi:hypothetical protein
MNWEVISAVGQIIGALAAVISLIYLAREVRSNARDRKNMSFSLAETFTTSSLSRSARASIEIRPRQIPVKLGTSPRTYIW